MEGEQKNAVAKYHLRSLICIRVDTQKWWDTLDFHAVMELGSYLVTGIVLGDRDFIGDSCQFYHCSVWRVKWKVNRKMLLPSTIRDLLVILATFTIVMYGKSSGR